jgi:hypothetical protein
VDTEGYLSWLTVNNFFLRDDLEIRRGVKSFTGQEQAWSLFHVHEDESHHRVIVLASESFSWAVEQAYNAAQEHLHEV